MRIVAVVLLSLLLSILGVLEAQQCGRQARGRRCAGGLCCSQYGFCGTSSEYCSTGCQSNCHSSASGSLTTTSSTPSDGGADITSLVSKTTFEKLLKHRNDAACQGKGFYTYEAFIDAVKAFGGFGTTGDDNTKKREVAAFLAQTSHQTTGGWPTAPDGPYAWGYCFVQKQEDNPLNYCDANEQYSCVPGKKYYGRGPIQISYNYNYGLAGRAIGSDLLGNPDAVANDPTISFKTALWFWMTPQSPKPSSHDVITGRWTPSTVDTAAGRAPGYGVITNIINGGMECGKGSNPQQDDRIGFYKRYCDIMGVGYGTNLDCYNQRPFNA